MSTSEAEQGKKWIEELIRRLAAERSLPVSEFQWWFDFDHRVHWLRATFGPREELWKFSDESLQDCVGDRNIQRALEKTLAAYFVPDAPEPEATVTQITSDRSFDDPYPTTLGEIQADTDYWVTRQGEGDPGSYHETRVQQRLDHLRNLEQRYLRQGEVEQQSEVRTAALSSDVEASGSEVSHDTESEDHRFARRAIEEARRSVSEDDDKPHPLVGAVVVKDGKILATAHRGEVKGNHAEFLALEKKLSDDAVAGATVYTTLEPCTTRSHPKIPCADRLIERKVKRVVIGMLDPDPRITGRGQRRLRKANVITDLFPHDLMSEVEELNRDFARHHDAAPAATELSPSHSARIEIRNLSRRVWPVERHGFTGAEYYIDVFNDSDGESLEGVRLELVGLSPDAIGFLPIPLHIKHENYDTREVSIHPKSARSFDILTGPVNDPRSQKVMMIPHTVNSERFPLPTNKYRMTIRASAKNIAPVDAILDAWIDAEGELRCECISGCI